MPNDRDVTTYWACPDCHSGLTVARRHIQEGTNVDPFLCPLCGTRLRAQSAPDPGNYPVRRRVYTCSNCSGHLTTTELPDTMLDQMVYHLSELMRLFSHPVLVANLGIGGQVQPEGQQLVMRLWRLDGTVLEYRDPLAEAFHVALTTRKVMPVEGDRVRKKLQRAIEKFDLPLRILSEDDKHFLVPEGAWMDGQVYGDADDPRYGRITFGNVPGSRLHHERRKGP